MPPRSNSKQKSKQRLSWKHKLERKYSKTVDETEKVIYLPMLAAKYRDRKRFLDAKEDYPLDGQPKLNGVRCLAAWAKERVVLTSRGGKEYVLPHIVEELQNSTLARGDVLDGELYVHDLPIQQLNSWIKGSHKHPEHVNVEYHVYDYTNPKGGETMLWSLRRSLLDGFFVSNPGLEKIKKVERAVIESEEAVYAYHAKCLERGYEGSIMRHADGPYKFGYRSKHLLKVKSFLDEEFEIVGHTVGIGKFSECVIYRCKTKEGKPFTVVPKGTFEERKQWLKEAPGVVGQWLKVEFAEWTKEGKPFHGVGVCIRMPEDMDPAGHD